MMIPNGIGLLSPANPSPVRPAVLAGVPGKPEPPETYSAPKAPSRGSAPARGLRGRDSPVRGGVPGGVVPSGGILTPNGARVHQAMPSSAAVSRIFSIGWKADPPRSTGASPP